MYTRPQWFHVWYAAIVLAGGARAAWLLNFPIGQAPSFAAPPLTPKAWPHPNRTTGCAGGTAVETRSRFVVASLLSGGEHNDVYITYACKLGVSLRRFVDVDMLLLLPQGVNWTAAIPNETTLQSAGWRTCLVPALGTPEQHYLYTKLAAWSLNYEAALMLDLDTLVLGDISPLFDLYPSLLRRHGALLAAVHDHPKHWSLRWNAAGDRFNAGVMLLLPDPALHRWLVDGLARIRYDDAMLEQAYLNAALPYMPLPLEYNTMTLSAYAEPATWARVLPDVRILHYTVPKPHRSCSEYYMAHVCKVWTEAPMD